ncbi:MAG: ABC transporter substrate-binding protein [Hyphomicrobium sp.]
MTLAMIRILTSISRAFGRGGPCAALALTAIALFSAMTATHARAAEADAATARYSIAVFVSSPADKCFKTAVTKSIEHFVRMRVARLNALSEFQQRKLRVDIYDDFSDPNTAIANVRKAIDEPTTVAMIGLSGSNRAKAVFDALGNDIGTRNIPFITDMSVTSLFEPYGNVFTMRPSQENERLPVIGRFLLDGKFQRPAYSGLADNAASTQLSNGLKDIAGLPPVVATRDIAMTDGKPDPLQLAAAIQDLKTSDADIALVMMGSAAFEQFLKEAAAAGIRSQLLLLTEGDTALSTPAAAAYGQTLYQLAWQTLPNIYNSRLRQQMLKDADQPWIFDDTPNALSSGWAAGTCKKPETASAPRQQLDTANLRAIGRGTRFADMVGLIGDIIKVAPADATLFLLRAGIVDGLKTNYASGHGTFRGAFDNWSFHPLRRTASQTPAILMRPSRTGKVRLAPTQYVKLRNDALRSIQTIYMDVDLTRVFRIDDNEKSFFAEFFMSFNKNDGFKISDIEFSNAFLDTENAGQQVAIAALHDGTASGIYPDGVEIYKVTGKFMMKPEFSRYPFDTQLFSVELKPKSGDGAFIIQPPPERLRDIAADTDGWSIKDQYVGFDEDYIPITDARTDEKSIVPFYKVDFSWVMQREATDYYLRVVVPLAFILIVAYLSIFIPREHFEAVVTIQVTALLSAVALYLSIPKVGTDAATLSDRIFLFDYMAVSLMIAISITRVNAWLRRFPRCEQGLRLVHVVGVPLLVIAMAWYVVDQTTGGGSQGWTGFLNETPVDAAAKPLPEKT